MEAISVSTAPIERVAIFDEAQREWDEAVLSDFMKRKKGVFNFNMSEPEFLISIMDRHAGWAVIICLIGGEQKINKGEYTGISGWFQALREKYSGWDVYIYDKITDNEYTKGESLSQITKGVCYKIISDVHLAVSLRSFRSEKMSDFVKALLDANVEEAKSLYSQIHKEYPIYVTGNLATAKAWVKSKAKGSQRYGLIASSGAKRLRQYGIWVQNKIDALTWFLNDKQDVRSSYFLEETATKFDIQIQGLELDWTIVCWDANLRYHNGKFGFYNFSCTELRTIASEDNILYLKNAYCVLLTRARQEFIIFVPTGDVNDVTRRPEY